MEVHKYLLLTPLGVYCKLGRQQIPPKCPSNSDTLHGVTSHITVFLILQYTSRFYLLYFEVKYCVDLQTTGLVFKD
jgi:hypothetical protein